VFGVGAEAAPFHSALAALVAPCARFAEHVVSGSQAIARRLAN